MSSKARSSAAMNGRDPPRNKKKKKPSLVTKPTSIPLDSLPYDLLLNCLARVSRLYYPTLSLVSKNFRSIIASSELHETRSRLNRTEKCLYLRLHFRYDPKTYWLTLCRRPNRTVTRKSSGYLMDPIPHMPPTQSSSLVVVGSNIYSIGGAQGSFYNEYYWIPPKSCRVSVLDCRSHTWREAPSMQMERNNSSAASLHDGKIYVAGGLEDEHIASSRWTEVFDIKTQTWGYVRNPCIFEWSDEFRSRPFVVNSLILEGKLYLFGDTPAVYNPEEGRWYELVKREERYNMAWGVKSCHCVVDDVLFYWDKKVFQWYDRKVSSWKELKGLEGLPDFRDRDGCKMVDFGGKIAFFWSECLSRKRHPHTRIWCAEITLERRDGDEFWGKVEWFDFVLSTHVSCSSFDVLSVSV